MKTEIVLSRIDDILKQICILSEMTNKGQVYWAIWDEGMKSIALFEVKNETILN